MGKEYTEAQKKASLAYQKEKKYIKAWVTPEQHKEYTAHAEKKGVPLGSLITELLDNDIRLYNSAIEYSTAYKEQGEDLTDFDGFISEKEKQMSG